MEKDPILRQENFPESQEEAAEDRSTIDDVIESLFQHISWKYGLFLVCLNLVYLSWPSQLYITVFAGKDPTPKDSWTCASQKCKDLVKENPTLSDLFPCQITKKENGTEILLLRSEDIRWDLDFTSFAIQFDMYCENSGNRPLKTFISSIYFIGAQAGSLFGGFLIDRAGRKITSILGYTVLVMVLLSGSVCHNVTILCVIRCFQGFGSAIVQSSTTVLLLELMPRRLRSYQTAGMIIFWGIGYILASGLHYSISDWNIQFLGAALVVAILGMPLLFSIESPRYHLINNDFDSTLKSLKALASLTGSNLELDQLNINL